MDHLAWRAGIEHGDLGGLIAQPHNVDVADYADLFLALFRAQISFVPLPVKGDPSLDRPTRAGGKARRRR
ncbi:hypothetical protein [Vineibacter terrae]|uniref:hypothetical protein n=1 Tax=Vineibacter terrae TaxID=2586908 RepID=UPI002E3000D4|nr:hypothetical protein [Vineibacter terrae]HEX2887885.1 hypothetical protein [Vineibacter terrae]